MPVAICRRCCSSAALAAVAVAVALAVAVAVAVAVALVCLVNQHGNAIKTRALFIGDKTTCKASNVRWKVVLSSQCTFKQRCRKLHCHVEYCIIDYSTACASNMLRLHRASPRFHTGCSNGTPQIVFSGLAACYIFSWCGGLPLHDWHWRCALAPAHQPLLLGSAHPATLPPCFSAVRPLEIAML